MQMQSQNWKLHQMAGPFLTAEGRLSRTRPDRTLILKLVLCPLTKPTRWTWTCSDSVSNLPECVKPLQPIDESSVTISFEAETLKFPAKVGIKSGYKVRFLFEVLVSLSFAFELKNCYRLFFSTSTAAEAEDPGFPPHTAKSMERFSLHSIPKRKNSNLKWMMELIFCTSWQTLATLMYS